MQPEYSVGDTSYSSALALNRLQVYISNNINYYDSLLINGYYKNSTYILADTGSPPVAYGWIPSYLGWFYPSPQKVENIPGEWENAGTQAILAAYSPDHGAGMIEEHTTTPSTSPISYGMTSAVVTAMAQWNQHQYNDPRFSTPTPALTTTAYIYGDYNPQTLPGIAGGAKTDGITNTTTLGPNDQVGISKFTDLTENFGQTSVISTIDGFPVGSLIWDDTQNAAYAAAHASELAKVLEAYYEGFSGPSIVKPEPVVATVFNLAQNYPDPFNPSTTIQFTVPYNGRAILKVFNVLGQEVATLFDGEAVAGTNHQVQFNASNLASGIYFYRLEFGGKMQVKKMLLLK
ncbi:MAG: T9SS type A sorting domain-containing protein [Bacteroidota bacterium]